MVPSDPLDPLIVRFADECAEHVAEMTRGLLGTEQRSSALDYGDIQRRLHTVKGAASIAGLTFAVQLAHTLETVIAECASGRLPHSPAVNDALLAAFDALSELSAAAADRQGPAAASAALERLDDLLATRHPSAALSNDLALVLSAHQLFMAERALASGWALWEIRLDAERSTFADRVRRLEEALAGAVQIIARTGASDIAPGAGVTYLMLVAVREQRVSPPLAESDLMPRVRQVESLPVEQPETHVEAHVEAQPEPSDSGDTVVSDDLTHLRGVFLENSAEKVQSLSDGLVRLEANPNDLDLVNDLFRHAHSLKGSGATFGMPVVTAIAHGLEEVLDRLRSGRSRVTSDAVSAMLASVDAFNLALRAPDTTEAGSPEVARAIALLEGALTNAAPVEARRPVPAPAAAEGDRRQGSVRVSLDKLDRAINRVGELAVTCAAAADRRRELETLAAEITRRRRNWERTFGASLAGRTTGSVHGQPDAELVSSLHAIVIDAEERLASTVEQLASLDLRTGSVLDALHQDVMGIRMVPLRSVFTAVPRSVRDLARAQRKQVELTVTGEETEIDKRILELLEDPLTHLVRNAVDHGIEDPDARRRSGKSPTGRISLSARQAGSHVVITIADDGAGIDASALRSAAVRKGMMAAGEAEQLDDQSALRLIFRPAMSLTEQVTEVSGRGVGLDVVMRHIQSLQGTIEVSSTPGAGATFTLRLPLTLAISDVLFVRVGDQQVCFPIVGVIAFLRIEGDRLTDVDGRTVLEFDGRLIRSVWLADALALSGAPPDRETAAPMLSAIIVSTAEGPVAVVVDEVLDHRRVVIKPIGALLGDPPGVAGATVTASGDVAIVLDAPGLLRAFGDTPARPRHAARSAPTVLVVDDSPTTQEMLRGILTAAGYQVETAESGEDAIRHLQRRRPAGMIVDVQMPGMDGFELTKRVKAKPEWRRVPVIILSALDSDADRRRGLDAGADAYAIKAGLDGDNFLRQVDMLVGFDRSPL